MKEIELRKEIHLKYQNLLEELDKQKTVQKELRDLISQKEIVFKRN